MSGRSGPIEPVRKVCLLALPAPDAFRLFTAHMGAWWPLGSHSIGGEGAAGVRFEEGRGGRLVELATSGDEHEWADVLAWQPPLRLSLSWHPTTGLRAATTVEVAFEAQPTGCRLRLEHRGWESFGEALGSELRAGYDPGWDVVLARFEAYASAWGAPGV